MRDRQSMPLFFKLWFAFVALLIAAIISGWLYMIASVVSQGPEGIGREVGRFLRGVEEGQR
jgi:hypothetical protein